MNSFTRRTFLIGILAIFAAAGLTGVHPVKAEMSLREYEAQLIQKKRDFQSYLNARHKSSESEQVAALNRRRSRERELRAKQEIELRYRKQMKRYSMEEIEARDRANEKQIELQKLQGESIRRDFVAYRSRLRKLELAISPVDEMKEFDIDMTKEPDFKSSYPSPEMTKLNTGSEEEIR